MPNTLAAIDLGSNSFHMIVTRMTDGHLQVVDRLKEMVQLGAGLDKKNRLSEEAQQRGLECLARFGQRLREIPDSRVRIVGTNTLRQARNGEAFLTQAEELLGHSVEIVSGVEEARLIYLGVAHSTAVVEGKRLVIDIGGGSTELIIGEYFEPMHLESLKMGCVSMTRKHFDSGKIKETGMKAAELEVRLRMEPVMLGYQEMGWGDVIGASGSIKAIRDVAMAEGWSTEGITLDALRQLRAALLSAGKVATIAKRWNLNEARAQVFTGGFTVLHSVCEVLGIERLQVSDGAMREGLIYDMVGRIRHEDVRDRTIATLSHRYGVDEDQAERVASTAQKLLTQVKSQWQLENEEYDYTLKWAARLYEVGLAIAHSQYHKHGAYILQHSDLPGFSRTDQELLAALVYGHRRKFPFPIFEVLPKDMILPAKRLCILLRLAVILHRGRSRQSLPAVGLRVEEQQIELLFPPHWLDEHPLTQGDLTREAEYLEKAGFKLEFGQAME